ncbi:hypothetical protein DFH29DRAFT_897137 [Suillus ampliporus]|nr:hypothetical protein DFH29DRAFT_897137 [Suillus ampliporus]
MIGRTGKLIFLYTIVGQVLAPYAWSIESMTRDALEFFVTLHAHRIPALYEGRSNTCAQVHLREITVLGRSSCIRT